MENLISDCFPPIFSYLPLSDVFNLRIVSRRLKQEIEDYLPTVRSLPLYLTTPRTPEAITRYENICLSFVDIFEGADWIPYIDKLSNKVLALRRLPFGSSGLGTFEDPTILQNQNHFRRSDFLILNHFSALLKFLPFIKKYCPNIDKLALVIDHCDHYLPEVSKVLRAFPAVKVLLLERTLQDACRNYDCTKPDSEQYLEDLIYLEENSLKLPPVVYDSIGALNHLEELYFFSKYFSQLSMVFEIGSREYRFLKVLLGRLRVLHFHPRDFLKLPVDCESEWSLEELACPLHTLDIMSKEHLIFPKLEKFIQFEEHRGPSNKSEAFESLFRPPLKVFDISHDHHSICLFTAQELNQFIGLERFHCCSFWIDADVLGGEPENYDLEIVPNELKNRTIKHLQVKICLKTEEQRKQNVRRWSKYFVALETCTFLQPEYSVFRVSDLRN